RTGDAAGLGEGHEVEVHRVEHQLPAHEAHDRVAPQQHAADAQREEQPRDEQGRTEQHHSCRFARTTAPTRLASNSTLVISNGTRYASKRGRATAATMPWVCDAPSSAAERSV